MTEPNIVARRSASCFWMDASPKHSKDATRSVEPQFSQPIGRDCRVSLLTPAGRGAIATIAVVGSGAVELVSRFFQPIGPRSLSAAPIRQIIVGHWRGDSDQLEEVVVARCQEATVEIHCHGGSEASSAIIASLREAGATETSATSWLQDHVPDPLSRAAWEALIHARTERVAGILLDQWRGALPSAIRSIHDSLHMQPADLSSPIEKVARLLQLADLGLHLTKPWRVVLAGAPNVGKSSLVNALVGYERSIVLDQPGTTRDVLSASTALDGWPVELLDTAGDRESVDLVEQEGTRRAWQQVREADLAVIVVDSREHAGRSVHPFQQMARKSLLVANKVDLAPSRAEIPPQYITTSAVTGEGLDKLAREITRLLIPSRPEPGEAVPFTPEQCNILDKVHSALKSGRWEFADAQLQQLLDGTDS